MDVGPSDSARPGALRLSTCHVTASTGQIRLDSKNDLTFYIVKPGLGGKENRVNGCVSSGFYSTVALTVICFTRRAMSDFPPSGATSKSFANCFVLLL